MSEPLVSIIMPAYNAERFIEESIRSVMAQTYRHWELIVVDDGSTDRTAKIAQALSARDPRIKCLRQPNKKVAGAKNTGINNSRGQLIAFIGADDLWLREKLALQVDAIEETGADILFSDGYLFPDNETADETRPFRTLKGRYSGAEMFELLLIQNRIPDLSVLFRQKVWRETGPFNEAPEYYRGCEDYEFWLRAAERGAVFYGMEERLVRYRLHSDSMTARKIETVAAEIATVKRFMSGRHARTRAIRRRFRDSYRALIAAFVAQNRIEEAQECMKELWKWDQFGLVTSLQRIIIRVAPGKYNAISERLYAAGSQISKYRTIVRQHASLPALK